MTIQFDPLTNTVLYNSMKIKLTQQEFEELNNERILGDSFEVLRFIFGKALEQQAREEHTRNASTNTRS